jgi:hypothetical protein
MPPLAPVEVKSKEQFKKSADWKDVPFNDVLARSKGAIAASRIPLWPASGWESRGS